MGLRAPTLQQGVQRVPSDIEVEDKKFEIRRLIPLFLTGIILGSLLGWAVALSSEDSTVEFSLLPRTSS
ncbi:hypothetical protein KIN20_007196 [Parelaphostrongylus tenuis]|uniref:Uncharacterized protein n=1 Tax=Parelaphostrongylus tenuis TaxID=148309 RepID=A0AAD5QLT4_PARTN|nr:hypothetical protein KIN20_007196 [Parelaphostrongylus tenuis]